MLRPRAIEDASTAASAHRVPHAACGGVGSRACQTLAVSGREGAASPALSSSKMGQSPIVTFGPAFVPAPPPGPLAASQMFARNSFGGGLSGPEGDERPMPFGAARGVF
ncbi:hypothetical protein HPB50_004197 [Hyalomma asiaticum]|uniref:Uncharacterized protein n=1 Tax=Hyalomma asiaticum TaxID=266040 RepID=A0ACB7SS80_HYAAI|nr:hypothetical protein HPB50_004197 [Hyalomma asiaticum]